MAGRYGWWTEASCKSDCRRFRAQESLKFEGKERGRRGGSVLPITCAGNAPWQLESAREEVAAVWQTTIFFSSKSGGGHDLVLRRLTGWRASSCSWPAAKSRACPLRNWQWCATSSLLIPRRANEDERGVKKDAGRRDADDWESRSRAHLYAQA